MNAARKFYAEDIPREASIGLKHTRQSRSSPDIALLFSLTLLMTLVTMAIVSNFPKKKLENHPMCGLTAGGKVGVYLYLQFRNFAKIQLQLLLNRKHLIYLLNFFYILIFFFFFAVLLKIVHFQRKYSVYKRSSQKENYFFQLWQE